MTPEVILFADSHKLADHLVKTWIHLANEVISEHGRFSSAFPGGRSPVEFYNLLSSWPDFNLWSKVHIFQTDERFVDEHHPDNNFRLIKDNLLRHVPIPMENVFPIPSHVETVGMAAEEYKNTLVRFFTLDRNHLPIIDFVLLGLGEDGHTASLFPGVDGINDPYRLTMPVSVNHLKHDRISLTLSVINNARNVIFLVTGSQKAEIIRDILEGEGDYPAAQVRPRQGKLTFLLDAQAAQLLEHRERYVTEVQPLSINPE